MALGILKSNLTFWSPTWLETSKFSFVYFLGGVEVKWNLEFWSPTWLQTSRFSFFHFWEGSGTWKSEVQLHLKLPKFSFLDLGGGGQIATVPVSGKLLVHGQCRVLHRSLSRRLMNAKNRDAHFTRKSSSGNRKRHTARRLTKRNLFRRGWWTDRHFQV